LGHGLALFEVIDAVIQEEAAEDEPSQKEYRFHINRSPLR
jgi:hypothetical protein